MGHFNNDNEQLSLLDLKIETERLLIRPFEKRDIQASYEMNLDAEVSRYTGDGGVVSLEEIEKRIVENVFGNYNKYGFGRLAVEIKGENKFIGFTGLKYLPDMDEVDLGYRFMREYWGQGIATESAVASINFGFKTLELDRIIGLALPQNKPSVRILEKLFFRFEREIIEDREKVSLYALQNPKYENQKPT
ncbi:MAG: GNAT family N-acetyltransferase [Crocinitomicaceae bacterium]|nr:GNAT family N-acetyltransferase [Crocinitomicaceae bacterium]|tara:strand:+ start:3355 stop:3927 length:573 start_codon:yes stop_codon:yes gene_type:complete